MKLEEQVCSLELAKKLKELGVKQESLLYWDEAYCDVGKAQVMIVADPNYRPSTVLEFSAFTVAELGELLPKGYWDESSVNGGFEIGYSQGKPMAAEKIDRYFTLDASEADARAMMLIYLLENKIITL